MKTYFVESKYKKLYVIFKTFHYSLSGSGFLYVSGRGTHF